MWGVAEGRVGTGLVPSQREVNRAGWKVEGGVEGGVLAEVGRRRDRRFRGRGGALLREGGPITYEIRPSSSFQPRWWR